MIQMDDCITPFNANYSRSVYRSEMHSDDFILSVIKYQGYSAKLDNIDSISMMSNIDFKLTLLDEMLSDDSIIDGVWFLNKMDEDNEYKKKKKETHLLTPSIVCKKYHEEKIHRSSCYDEHRILCKGKINYDRKMAPFFVPRSNNPNILALINSICYSEKMLLPDRNCDVCTKIYLPYENIAGTLMDILMKHAVTGRDGQDVVYLPDLIYFEGKIDESFLNCVNHRNFLENREDDCIYPLMAITVPSTLKIMSCIASEMNLLPTWYPVTSCIDTVSDIVLITDDVDYKPKYDVLGYDELTSNQQYDCYDGSEIIAIGKHIIPISKQIKYGLNM